MSSCRAEHVIRLAAPHPEPEPFGVRAEVGFVRHAEGAGRQAKIPRPFDGDVSGQVDREAAAGNPQVRRPPGVQALDVGVHALANLFDVRVLRQGRAQGIVVRKRKGSLAAGRGRKQEYSDGGGEARSMTVAGLTAIHRVTFLLSEPWCLGGSASYQPGSAARL